MERVGTDIGRIMEELSKPEIAQRNPPAQRVAQHQPQLLPPQPYNQPNLDQPQPYVGYGQNSATQEARHDLNKNKQIDEQREKKQLSEGCKPI